MYLNTFMPGQYSVPNYTIPGAGDTVDFYAGQYARLEPGQHNFTLSSTHVHLPYPYQPTSTATLQANSFWRELETYNWLEGAVLELSWGNIEKTEGVYTLDFYDAFFNTIRAFKKPKRVMFLLNMRHLNAPDLGDFIPAYLQTMPGTNVVNGISYYKNTTTYPTSGVTPIQNARKYDHAWACAGRYDDALGTQTFKGYNFNMHMFRAAAGTNTLKTKFYAFLEALAAKYADEPLFAGFVGTESATGEILTTINGSVTTKFEGGNEIRPTYEGRLEIVKKIKSLFPNKIMAECVNFDRTYYDDLTGKGATQGKLIKNRLGFSTANLHIGSNLLLDNINANMKGNVPVVMQVQPLDQRTMTGNQPSWKDWQPTPPDYGNPSTTKTGYTTINASAAWDDPPTPAWLWERIKYFNSNMVIYQRNKSASPAGVTWCTWPVWVAFMNDAARKDLPYGGMIGTKPKTL